MKPFICVSESVSVSFDEQEGSGLVREATPVIYNPQSASVPNAHPTALSMKASLKHTACLQGCIQKFQETRTKTGTDTESRKRSAGYCFIQPCLLIILKNSQFRIYR